MAGLWYRFGQRLRFRWSSGRKAAAGWLERKRRVDRDFDRVHGVDTGGVTSLGELEIASEHRHHGSDHIAIDPAEFALAMSRVDVPLDGFTFVDLGSGKGRALLLAIPYPFRRIVGVEFAPALCETAERNVEAYLPHGWDGPSIEILCEDASRYELPLEPLVVYLYNPFGAEVMRLVARRLLASHARWPRPIRIVYSNPFHAYVLVAEGFRVVAGGDLYAVFAPP